MKRWEVTAILQGEREMGEYEAETRTAAEEKAWKDIEDCVSLCVECAEKIDGISVLEMEATELVMQDRGSTDSGGPSPLDPGAIASHARRVSPKDLEGFASVWRAEGHLRPSARLHGPACSEMWEWGWGLGVVGGPAPAGSARYEAATSAEQDFASDGHVTGAEFRAAVQKAEDE